MNFDGQAQSYDERAGLPEDICRQVAAYILDGAPARVLDIGAGTGLIGRHLKGVRYLGLDVSRPMLAQFAQIGAGLLLQADANGAWPLADHSIDVILFSRSAHLLKSERTQAEVRRVAAPGCRVLVGRVRRPRESAGEQLKRTLQQLLRDRNLPGKNGERAARDFLEALEAAGARRLPQQTTTAWTRSEAPIESLHSWRGKDGLAGRTVSDELKGEILADLTRWAEAELGDLSGAREVERHYQLEGVQFAE